MLNEAFIAEWTTALRSGEFAQGSGALKKGDKYCCLGVACELLRRKGKLPAWDIAGELSQHIEGTETIDGQGLVLPAKAQEYIGFYTSAGEGVRIVGDGTPDEYYVSLAEANDNGVIFPQIADVLDHWLAQEKELGFYGEHEYEWNGEYAR